MSFLNVTYFNVVFGTRQDIILVKDGGNQITRFHVNDVCEMQIL